MYLIEDDSETEVSSNGMTNSMEPRTLANVDILLMTSDHAQSMDHAQSIETILGTRTAAVDD
jgi:hypothetical protein